MSSEEFGPRELVEFGTMAEEVGFDFLTVSDHFHPWTQSQGHSPFVWTTIGGVAMRTKRVAIGTGVTCPILRNHPRGRPAAATSFFRLTSSPILSSGSSPRRGAMARRARPTGARGRGVPICRRCWRGNVSGHPSTVAWLLTVYPGQSTPFEAPYCLHRPGRCPVDWSPRDRVGGGRVPSSATAFGRPRGGPSRRSGGVRTAGRRWAGLGQ